MQLFPIFSSSVKSPPGCLQYPKVRLFGIPGVNTINTFSILVFIIAAITNTSHTPLPTDLNTLYLNILYQRWRICCVIIPQNQDCVCGNEKWWDYILFIVILDDLRDEMSIFKFPNIFANMLWSLSFPILCEINTRVILGYKWSTSSSMTITITKC